MGYAPQTFGIGTVGHIHTVSLLELSLGAAIGASGSVIAFAKLNGNMAGPPITFKGQQLVNLLLALGLTLLIGRLMSSGGAYAGAYECALGRSQCTL